MQKIKPNFINKFHKFKRTDWLYSFQIKHKKTHKLFYLPNNKIGNYIYKLLGKVFYIERYGRKRICNCNSRHECRIPLKCSKNFVIYISNHFMSDRATINSILPFCQNTCYTKRLKLKLYYMNQGFKKRNAYYLAKAELMLKGEWEK